MLLEKKRTAVSVDAEMSRLINARWVMDIAFTKNHTASQIGNLLCGAFPSLVEKTSVGKSCFSCHSLLLNQFASRCKLLRTNSLYEVSVELMIPTDNCPTFPIRQKIEFSSFKLFKWNWTLLVHLISNEPSSSAVQMSLD